MHALMNFYIGKVVCPRFDNCTSYQVSEIESQYYQKFTVRYHISEIIKRIWDNHLYREKLELESKWVHKVLKN